MPVIMACYWIYNDSLQIYLNEKKKKITLINTIDPNGYKTIIGNFI